MRFSSLFSLPHSLSLPLSHTHSHSHSHSLCVAAFTRKACTSLVLMFSLMLVPISITWFVRMHVCIACTYIHVCLCVFAELRNLCSICCTCSLCHPRRATTVPQPCTQLLTLAMCHSLNSSSSMGQTLMLGTAGAVYPCTGQPTQPAQSVSRPY